MFMMWWVWHARDLVRRRGMVMMWWVWHVHDMVGRGRPGSEASCITECYTGCRAHRPASAVRQ